MRWQHYRTHLLSFDYTQVARYPMDQHKVTHTHTGAASSFPHLNYSEKHFLVFNIADATHRDKYKTTHCSCKQLSLLPVEPPSPPPHTHTNTQNLAKTSKVIAKHTTLRSSIRTDVLLIKSLKVKFRWQGWCFAQQQDFPACISPPSATLHRRDKTSKK